MPRRTAFNFASKRVATRVARDLMLTTYQGRRFAVAPTGNTYGDTFLGVWSDELGRFRAIGGCSPSGRVDPLPGELMIGDRPAIGADEWEPIPADPFAVEV